MNYALENERLIRHYMETNTRTEDQQVPFILGQCINREHVEYKNELESKVSFWREQAAKFADDADRQLATVRKSITGLADLESERDSARRELEDLKKRLAAYERTLDTLNKEEEA